MSPRLLIIVAVTAALLGAPALAAAQTTTPTTAATTPVATTAAPATTPADTPAPDVAPIVPARRHHPAATTPPAVTPAPAPAHPPLPPPTPRQDAHHRRAVGHRQGQHRPHPAPWVVMLAVIAGLALLLLIIAAIARWRAGSAVAAPRRHSAEATWRVSGPGRSSPTGCASAAERRSPGPIRALAILCIALQQRPSAPGKNCFPPNCRDFVEGDGFPTATGWRLMNPRRRPRRDAEHERRGRWRTRPTPC